jgi:glycosyltransferase A (GT-A) superfamily protein (DUF2064 family)
MAWSLPEDCVLGIFGTRTEPGEDGLGGLRDAMLFDLLDLWESRGVIALGGRKVLVYAPGHDEVGAWFDTRVPAAYALQPQTDGDRGGRLAAFFAGEFEEGARRVVAIASEAPTLDPSFVIAAFVALEGRDVVLGPSTDGGYYLAGCRLGVPPCFEGIDWNRGDVLAQTIDRLDATGLTVAVLPPWYVVATSASVLMLRGHLLAMRRAGMDLMVPRTEAWLESGSF